MRYTGKIAGLARDFETGRPVVQIAVEEDPAPLSDLKDKQIRVEITPYRKKRSLDANAYYWVLLTRLADVLRISKPYLHNMLLRRYGRPQVYDDRVVYLIIPESDKAREKVDEDEYTHLKPTAELKEGRDGRMYRTYILMKGSHEYNTEEMSILIEGLIDECKQVGIETLTPDELKKMMEAYEKHH